MAVVGLASHAAKLNSTKLASAICEKLQHCCTCGKVLRRSLYKASSTITSINAAMKNCYYFQPLPKTILKNTYLRVAIINN